MEKSGGNLGHIHRVTPATTPLTTGRIIGRRSTFSLQSQCFHEVWAHSENSAPLSGRTVGSAVGNPGEQGGEQGGEPRGARWGAGWGTPGSKVGSRVGNPRGSKVGNRVGNPQRFTQHHRARNLRRIRWNVSARNRMRHMRRVGRPRLPARPTSSAVCVRRQSSSLRLSQRRS